MASTATTEEEGLRELANKKGGPGGPEKYRGVEYSVAKQAEGVWVWKLHSNAGRMGAVLLGTAKGMNKQTAVDAALQAIDKMLSKEALKLQSAPGKS